MFDSLLLTLLERASCVSVIRANGQTYTVYILVLLWQPKTALHLTFYFWGDILL